MSFFYRFRSTRALLDERHELGRQEIYFCPPEGLNDPIEGFKDLFWRGDEIIWRNLLKHYVLCLMRSFSIAVVGDNNFGQMPSKSIILGSEHNLPTEQIKALFRRICEAFFETEGMSHFPAILAHYPYPLRRDGLAFCLRGVHAAALNAVLENFRESKLLPAEVTLPVSKDDAAQLLDSVTTAIKKVTSNDEQLDRASVELAFLVGDSVHRQVELMNYTRAPDDAARAWQAIFQFFPETYVEQLGSLVFSDWYAACFVADPNHAAMWGHYGDGHKGVCLKFRSESNSNGDAIIKLNGLAGGYAGPQGAGSTHGDRELRFAKMHYVERFVEVDFFRSIGTLPIPILRTEWFSDDDGNVSSCADEIFSSPDEWHQRYWEVFNSVATAKFRDWRYEEEYRLVLTSALQLFTETKDRKLKYRFADLEGLIFGLRTSLSDKHQIIEIIGAKCKEQGRKEFEFSEAAYNASDGKFVTRTLSALRFE
jgi:hypothetical protein